MPTGLKESQKLEKPLFTPSTKAEQGQHDENIHPDKRTPTAVMKKQLNRVSQGDDWRGESQKGRRAGYQIILQGKENN